MHDAGVRTRALSLRADTLKCCIDYGDRGGARTHDSSLLPRRDNPYATSTGVIVVIVIVVAEVTICYHLSVIPTEDPNKANPEKIMRMRTRTKTG